MPLPPTCTITGAWLNADETAATGQVVITPVAAAPGSSYIVVARPIITVLVAGAISVTLVNNADFSSLQYQVVEQIDGTPADSYVVTPTGSSLTLQTAPRGGAITPIYVLASVVGQAGGVASLDGTGKVPLAQLPVEASEVASVTAANGTITIGGTATNPTVAVDVIAQAQVSGLSTALSANTTAITTETSRAETAEAALYTKPAGGIPSTDMTSAVQTALGEAASAVQSVTAADATVTIGGTSTSPTVKVGLSTLDTRYGITVNVLNYGAKRNYASGATGAMTATSAVLTDINAAFTAANVGQSITVVGAGAAGADLSSTIASVTSGTQVTLAATAATTVSGATYAYGTSDTAAIQAAITAAGTVGATVFLPPGGYVLSAPIVPASNVALIGAGIGNTTLWPFGTAAAVQVQASSGSPLASFTMAHLTIDGARQVGPYNVATKGIFTQYCTHLSLDDLVVQNCVATGIGADFLTAGSTIHNCRAINNGRLNHAGIAGGGGNGIGIGTGGYTVEDWVISDCYATGNGRYGIMMECQFASLAAMPTGMRITNCYSSANFGHGYGDAGGSGAVWSNCIAATNAFDGFSVDNGTIGATAQPSGNSVYSGCVATGNTRYGFSYQPTASNTQSVAGAGNILYTGCKSFGNTSLGFNVNSVAAHPVAGISWLGCEAYSNGASGWQIQAASNDLKLSGCKGNANGQVSATSKVGVLLGANVTGLHIEGCRFYDDGATQKQAYGIQIATGVTVSTATVTGNDLRGNLTGAFNMLGTWSAAVLDANPGYDGTATRSTGPASAGRVRPDTVTNWISNNPTLGLGELGYETDTRQVKIGDGASGYTALGYAAPAYLDQLAAAAIAAVAVTMDPMNAQGSPGITTGRPYFCLAHIAANQTMSAMDIDIVAVGGTTTVSTTFMGIYDVASGNLLAQTADFSSSLTAGLGTTLLKVPLAGAPIAAQNIGRPVYLVFLASLAGTGASLTVIGGRQFGSNQSAASPNGRLFTNSAGTTLTALPGTVPTLVQTSGFSMPYLGVYH